MIVQYMFDATTGEEASRTYFNSTGPTTYFGALSLFQETRELVAITVKEGLDAWDEFKRHFGDDSAQRAAFHGRYPK